VGRRIDGILALASVLMCACVACVYLSEEVLPLPRRRRRVAVVAAAVTVAVAAAAHNIFPFMTQTNGKQIVNNVID
jgi:multisubunit Na+/H+ antiporter MnhB subunit